MLRQALAARMILLALCVTSALTTPMTGALAQAQAQAQAQAFDDPESTIVSDLIVVAPGYGPAWWKVSNGDSVVWIMGLPPTIAPLDLKWDKRTLERRLSNARALYLPPDGKTTLDGRWEAPLPAYTQARIALAAVKAGFEPQPYIEPPTLMAVLKLRRDFQRKAGLGFDPEDEIRALARRAKVPAYKSQGLTVRLGPEEFKDTDPEVNACLQAMLDEVETDPSLFRASAVHWAEGRPAEALAGPRGAYPVCMNRMLPGYSRLLIDAQTAEISGALRTPGKAVAVVPMRLLVAQGGVLERLRVEGYTIADPRRQFEQ